MTIIDANGNEQTLETTDGHPLWVVTDEPDLDRAARSVVDENGVLLYHENLEPGLNGFWVEAKDLRVGDVFLGANGELSTLTNIVRVEQSGGIAVFNFTVEGNHNYFILAKEYEYGQSCVLVHNAVFYKAPQRGRSQDQIRDEILNGFDPKNYPDEGVFFTDRLSIAQKYEFNYENGIQKFTMDDGVFNNLTDKRIIQIDTLESNAWHVKGPDNINLIIDDFLNREFPKPFIADFTKALDLPAIKKYIFQQTLEQLCLQERKDIIQKISKAILDHIEEFKPVK